jgi:N-acetylneuraminic acid mutarotase
MMKKIMTVVLICLAGMANADSWTRKADFPGASRRFPVSFTIGNKGYVGLGVNTNYLSDFWEYDQPSNTWTQLSDFPDGGRAGAVGFSINNLGYVGTGFNGNFLKDFWEFNPATNSWNQKTDFGGTGRSTPTGFSIGNNGYVGFGEDSSGIRNDFWEWIQATNTWVQKSPVIANQLLTYNPGFSINGRGFVGYFGNNTYLINEYDTLGNHWQSSIIYNGAQANSNASGFPLCGECYFGLMDDQSPGYDLWQYDPSTTYWNRRSRLGNGIRENAVAFSINNKGYMGMGDSAGINYYNDFWAYTPDNPCTTGIEDLPADNLSIEISPNPFQNKTLLTIQGSTANATLNVYNIEGKVVYKMTGITGTNTRLTITHEQLADGIYFYQLMDANEALATGKMIVE